MNRRVFLDTVGLVATWDRRDQWHVPATRVYSQLLTSKRIFLTTTLVLMECGNAVSRKSARTDVVNLRTLLARRGWLISPTDADTDAAWAEYSSHPPGGPGIVDCVSFQVMRRLGLTHAFTNDTHFRAAGFVPLF